MLGDDAFSLDYGTAIAIYYIFLNFSAIASARICLSIGTSARISLYISSFSTISLMASMSSRISAGGQRSRSSTMRRIRSACFRGNQSSQSKKSPPRAQRIRATADATAGEVGLASKSPPRGIVSQSGTRLRTVMALGASNQMEAAHRPATMTSDAENAASFAFSATGCFAGRPVELPTSARRSSPTAAWRPRWALCLAIIPYRSRRTRTVLRQRRPRTTRENTVPTPRRARPRKPSANQEAGTATPAKTVA